MSSEEKYVRKVSDTQSKYRVVKKNITQQSSYNLPIELESELLKKGAIKRTDIGANDKNIYYCLNDGVRIIFGKGLLNIIGDKYKDVNAKIILVHTNSNGKFQIRRNEHNQESEEYNWFRVLYDNNLEGANFIVSYDEDKKEILIDNEILLSELAKEDDSTDVNEIYDYSEEDLAEILKEMYVNSTEKVVSIHLFGIKYGFLIEEKQFNRNRIIQLAGINDSYIAELNKGISLGKHVVIANNHPNVIVDNVERLTEGCNKIYYGAPGCGKSHYVEEHYCSDEDKYERITFHQEYTNGDFVGQIRPIVENDIIKYDFVAGPLTKLLKKAFAPENVGKMYYLIIEELNRGNAPAIFGDVFQLLDRDKNTGNSEYLIDNDDMSKEIFGEIGHKVYIPGNVSIIATMNSSDQNVFVLDTAFKRRWEWIKITNKFEDKQDTYTQNLASMIVPGMDRTWREFLDVINNEILDEKYGSNGEDKQMGIYFVNDKILSVKDTDINIKKKEFAEKVFMYLWEDVVKYDRNSLFNDYKTLDDLIEDYVRNGIGVFKDNIFPKVEEKIDE